MNFVNMLSPWQWGLLAAVPAAVVLLYFLKLKRQPLEVPSTYLWRKAIEDIHVNSLWQRLRRNLLLWLQLLLVALVALALARPGWRGTNLVGDRFIFLIDNSASMNAADVAPSRLAEAKRRALDLVNQMKSGDVAMVVSFADSARVEQPFTNNRRELRRGIEAIAPTRRATSLSEALRVAAGLANPSRSAFEISDTHVAESLPATLYLFSDGKFPDVSGFSLGNLEPQYVPIGLDRARNVAIVEFNARRSEADGDRLQVFARLENRGEESVQAEAELLHDGETIDAASVKLEGNAAESVVFTLDNFAQGNLELRLLAGGDLADDDRAHAIVQPRSRSKVLVVTPGNESLRLALETETATKLADIRWVDPAYLETPDYQTQAAAGEFSLVIFDQCRPPEAPAANTLWFGATPPGNWSHGAASSGPQILDVNESHPLMQLVDLGNVRIAEGTSLQGPPGAVTLIDSTVGPLAAIAPRDNFEDCVLGLVLVGESEGRSQLNTDWPLRLSFPVFLFNVLDYLGGTRQLEATASILPGQPAVLQGQTTAASLTVRSPGGATTELRRAGGDFLFSRTDELGAYRVEESGASPRYFAVNLFDSRESDIRPRPEGTIQIGSVKVKGGKVWEGARRETWKLLLVAGLFVLLLEWYIYNRRLYI